MGKSYHIISADSSFLEHAWNKFDLQVVVRQLLCPEPSFAGHKECLFAAICGWIIDPEDLHGVRQNMIASTAAAILTAAEQRFIGHKQFQSRIDAFYGRLIDLPPPFFTEIYYQIGGLSSIRDAALAGKMQEKLEQSLWNHQLGVTMLGVRHQCMTRSVVSDSDLPSKIISNLVAGDITHVLFDAIGALYAPSGSKIAKSNYKNVEQSVSLTYAAATIVMPDNRSFFHLIFDLEKKSFDFSSICALWFSRAIYAAKNLILNEDLDAAHRIICDLPIDLSAGHFDPPVYIHQADNLIQDLQKNGALARYHKPGGRQIILKKYGVSTPKPNRTRAPKGLILGI
ncbi:hypothetical protein [Methylorubrum extorquens]|uniref:Uncharacterized protein n=1 Tax=Methylorubrum extorquens TaxID=408 RepID=A0AAX3WDT2_METEX|nr:hypothetical protein [Methylorubrum extorquens]WHQ68795.1 hypothetical protein KEC54_20965 [Methylorubrum extorquens]